jgi:hypothetical protein
MTTARTLIDLRSQLDTVNAKRFKVVSSNREADPLVQLDQEQAELEARIADAEAAERLEQAAAFKVSAVTAYSDSLRQLYSALDSLGSPVVDIIQAARNHDAVVRDIQTEAAQFADTPRVTSSRYSTIVDGVSIRYESEAVAGAAAKVLSQMYDALNVGVFSQWLQEYARGCTPLQPIPEARG